MKIIKLNLSIIIFECFDNKLVQQIPNAVIYNQAKHQYYLLTTEKNINNLLALISDVNSDRHKLNKLKEKLYAYQTKYAICKVIGKDINHIKVSPKLREYQKEDVMRLLNYDYIGLFNDPRTGKTATILEWLRIKNIKKILIICPKSLQDLVWKNEIPQWYNLTIFEPFANDKPLSKEKRLNLYNSFFSDEIKEGFLVISKDTFKLDYKDINFQTQFACVVDEAHWLRNNRTNSNSTLQSKSLTYIRQFTSQIALLTGSPVVNHNSDLFGMMRLLHPKRFERYYQFLNYFWNLDYYNNPHKYFKDAKASEPSALQEEFYDYVGSYYIRRTQQEIIPWLPELKYRQIYVPMSANQRKTLLQFYKELNALAKHDERRLGVFMQMRLSAIIEDGKKSNKLKWIVEFLESIEEKEQVVIFSSFSHKVIPFLEAVLSDNKILYKSLIGDTPLKHRETIIKDFKEQKFKVLLCNIQVAKEGLNLSNAGYAIFVDRSFNPADNKQAEARIKPVDENQVSDKVIIDLITKKSIEEHILSLLDQKEDITKYILNNDFSDFFRSE